MILFIHSVLQRTYIIGSDSRLRSTPRFGQPDWPVRSTGCYERALVPIRALALLGGAVTHHKVDNLWVCLHALRCYGGEGQEVLFEDIIIRGKG